MGDLAGEVGGGQALLGQRPHGLADGLGRLAGQAAEHLPLFGHAEAFESGVTLPCAALDVLLQALQQAVLAAAAEQEVGTATQVFLELAHAIVRDGEGATKFVTIEVSRATSVQEALDVAYTVAHSPLVKTALFASHPNWGRILAAVGRAGVAGLDLNALEIWLGDVCLVRNGGRAADYSESRGQAVMDGEEITIHIDLGRGNVSERVWTCDFSHDYVTINAEYRT